MTYFSPGNLLRAVAAAAALVFMHAAFAQGTPETATSSDGLLTLTLASANPSDAAGINNTYTWTATNNSTTVTINGVTLGSHFGDWCGGFGCTPPGPTLISAPGCAGQSGADVPNDAHFGVWCTPLTGVTLLPGQSVSGSVTLRPGAGGPPDYTVYSFYIDPKTGAQVLTQPFAPMIHHSAVVAPAATDIQIKGAASNGSPPAGSTFSYTFQVKNAGPWGTYGGVILVDTLPSSLTFQGVSVSPSTALSVFGCSVVGQVVMCPLDEMQVGGTTNQATVTINAMASATPQQISNTATALVVSPQTDANTTNNTATVVVTTK